MSLPDSLTPTRRITGGSINEAWQVRLPDGTPAFVKTRPDAAAGEYAREAAGLRWLGEVAAVRVPEVLDVSEGYLALEWIESGHLDAAGQEDLGRGLAAMHAAGAPCFGEARAGEVSTIGSLRLPNEPRADWPSFFRECRLEPVTRIARDRGAITQAATVAVGGVCERLAELCGPAEPPARLHGDLWGGNVMGDAQGRAWLIDPSAYGGHREVDLAMLRLFGAPSERVFDAYEEASPLADGWRDRVELYQLLPLLVHAALFGGSYGDAAERAARRYAN